mgnify:FL=1
MAKQKVLFLKGIPGSGKSTFARELVDKGGWKRVNKDDLRAMLDGGKWSKKNEQFVKDRRDEIIISALDDGYNVVVDDTNIQGDHIGHITELVLDKLPHLTLKLDFETKFFDTPVAECIRRDSLRPNPVGKKVIRRMYDLVKDEYFPVLEYNPDLPTCIIVDIDGTLAHMNGRSPYDYTKVKEDSLDEAVADLVAQTRGYKEYDRTYVVIVSGRDDTCKQDTEEWLKDNGVEYDELYMRDHTRLNEDGTKVDDTIIKKEIYEQYIKPRYNVKFVLDDRQRVVDMWRKQGLKVLQVAEGEF